MGAAVAAVSRELARLDKEASRFRSDSEISRIHAAGGGLFLLSEGLAEAIFVALAAARWTDGLVDPTVGRALVELGYDRDFAAVVSESHSSKRSRGPAAPLERPTPGEGFGCVALEGRLLRLPAGVLLDLGATAKGLGSDRSASAAFAPGSGPGGVLVSLGGDVAVAGEPPVDGWPVEISEGVPGVGAPGDRPGTGSASQLVRLPAGGIATSSTALRRWRRAGRTLHHIIDPRTGLPACGPWRTASVAAASCAEANAAATAALVAGEDAVGWLASTGLPARLVGGDGRVRYLGDWPTGEGERLPEPGRPMLAGGRALTRSAR
jgi:thiamine biosynthesis lipoprotein